MDKAEEFYNNMETPLPSTFDGYVRKSVMFEFAEQYAQQIAIKFAKESREIAKIKDANGVLKFNSYEEVFVEWKNQ